MEAETSERLIAENEQLRKRVTELSESLQQSQRLLQAVVDRVPGLVYVKTLDWRVSVINRAGAAFIDRTPEQVVGKQEEDFFPPELVARWRTNDMSIVASGRGSDVEEMAPYPDGIHVHRSIKFPIFDGAGAVWGVGGISIDMTDQRRAEKRLVESETDARAMIDASTDVLLLVDMHGRVLAANQSAARVQGKSSAELVGMQHIFPLDQADQATSLLEEVTRTNKPIQYEESRREGLFDVSIYPVTDSEGKVTRMAVFARDVTERRLAEEKHKRLQLQIIETQRAALRELSTPLIPLTHDTVVMPLIGTVDSKRAQQLMETLLDGVATRRASLAIVDVTGVTVVDTQVAEALIKAARAVKLLGAEVVMTGIGPVLSQTLVQLGVTFTEIATLGSLQDGVAYALKVQKASRK